MEGHPVQICSGKVRKMRSVLVTCGATISFPGLIETIVDSKVLKTLKELGYERILLQYGRGYGPEFVKLVENRFKDASMGSKSDISLIQDAQVVKIQGLQIYGFEFSRQIETLIQEYADLVVSHAGTGSILDSLRLEKPLIVVVNDTLMDNHQQLIANKFEQQKLLWAIHARVPEMVRALERSEGEQLCKIGSSYNKQFEQLLCAVACE